MSKEPRRLVLLWTVRKGVAEVERCDSVEDAISRAWHLVASDHGIVDAVEVVREGDAGRRIDPATHDVWRQLTAEADLEARRRAEQKTTPRARIEIDGVLLDEVDADRAAKIVARLEPLLGDRVTTVAVGE